MPRGESLRAAVRTVAPRTTPPASPVPATLSARELRKLPSPEEIGPASPDEPRTFEDGFDVRPLPGGCLVSFGPRRPR